MTETAGGPDQAGRRGAVGWWIALGALVVLLAGTAMAWRPLAARYWVHRLRVGEDTTGKLESLDNAALPALLDYIESCPVEEIGTDLGINFIFYEKKIPTGAFWTAVGTAGSASDVEGWVHRRLARPDLSPRERARLWCVLGEIDTPSARETRRRLLAARALDFDGWDPYLARAAVERGLKFLAARQGEDGGWSAAEWSADGASDVELTSLAILSYLGAGYTPKIGRYRAQVAGAQKWLLERQAAGGSFARSMRDHALAAAALTEAYSMLKVPELKGAVQRALTETVRRQRPDGGWGGAKDRPADPLASLLSAGQLHSAKVAGLTGGKEAQGRAAGLRLWPGAPGGGGAGPETAAYEGARLCLLSYTREHRILGSAADALLKDPRDVLRNPTATWWGTFLVFNMGGQRWKTWNAAMKKRILADIKRSGTDTGGWSGGGPEARRLGPVGTTALRTLTLEIYYRYLPVYSR